MTWWSGCVLLHVYALAPGGDAEGRAKPLPSGVGRDSAHVGKSQI